jgi:hypothetical protein
MVRARRVMRTSAQNTGNWAFNLSIVNRAAMEVRTGREDGDR